MLIRVEGWCLLTSGPEFSGVLKPGNWGAEVVEVILDDSLDISIDDRSVKGRQSVAPFL